MYPDTVRSGIDSVLDDAPHRAIDLAIVNAQKEFGDKAKLAIMIPPLIFGFNPAHKRVSIQLPLKHRFSGQVGKGLAVESSIHVLDLSRAYVVLHHHMEKSPPSVLLGNPYFFCESSGDHEHSWLEVAKAIGQGLHTAGKLQDPAPRTISDDLYNELFADSTSCVLGLNSRSRAVRLRELGWQPQEKDWKRSLLEDELPQILQEKPSASRGYFTGARGTQVVKGRMCQELLLQSLCHEN